VKPEAVQEVIDPAVEIAAISELIPEDQASTPREGDEPLAASSELTGAATPAEAEIPMEEVEIDVWWPRDTGPFRRERPKQDARHRHKRKERPERKPEAAEGALPPPKAPKPPERRRPERRPEKPIDPDSPFAVLGTLKAQLAKKT
jgi:ATP-dependent RNA helicase SUPV3L1/SUV3